MKRWELIIGLFFLALSGLYIDSVASDELETAIKVIIWSIVAMVLIGILAMAFIAIASIRLRLKLYQSQINVATRNSEIFTLTASADEQVYIRDQNLNANWINPALDPRARFGPASPRATYGDQQRWQMFMEVKALGAMPNRIVNQASNDGLEAPAEVLHFSIVAQRALASRGAGRFIVFGSMDSGKTTLAKWTVQYAIQEIVRKQNGRIFIIDPHAPKIVWGDDLTVIGAGMDYKSIRAFLDYVKSDIKARYEAGCGNDSVPLPEPYRPNFIICEEWTGVIAELKSNKRWTDEDNRMFYMDSRKAGWGYLLVAHEKTVGALGLTGMGNLLAGVEYFVTLDKNAITNDYSAKLGSSFKDKNTYNLITPGPFNGRMYYSDVQARGERYKINKYLALPASPSNVEDNSIFDLDIEPKPEPEPNDEEVAIIEAFITIKNGPKFSWTKATKLAFGPGKFGTNYTAKLCRILDKFNVDYSQQKVSK